MFFFKIASFEAALFITNDYLIPIVRQVEANLLHYSVDVSFVQSKCCFFYQWQSNHCSNYIEIALHKPMASWYLSSRLKNDSINWNLEPYLHKHYWDFLNQLLQFYLSIQIRLICLKSKRISVVICFFWRMSFCQCKSGSWRIRLRLNFSRMWLQKQIAVPNLFSLTVDFCSFAYFSGLHNPCNFG